MYFTKIHYICKINFTIMDKLIIKSNKKIRNISLEFKRYLLDEINWNSQLIAIKGARGVGKTTLILQRMALVHLNSNNALYISMENPYFYENHLIDLAEEFYNSGGEFLFLDEVHKYPNWSREIKLIYDDFPELKVVFTSSSILDIYKGESDLSRRAVSYTLNNLSLREYIEFNNGIKIEQLTLSEIINNHTEISFSILEKIKPIAEFNNFVKFGAYPYFKEDIELYYQKLIRTINLIIDVDINSIYNPDYKLIHKTKHLLFSIASSAPFIPNITKLSERIGVSRPTLLKVLNYLEQAVLIIQASKTQKGISSLSKPDKIYIQNPNLIYALAEKNANVGNIRETFFINQVQNSKHKVNISKSSDFIVNNKYTFEIGGKNKTDKQIQKLDNAFIVKDNIETGVNTTIPLWLFGFLY